MDEVVSRIMIRKAVCGVLNSWTALKIAVEERMGGSASRLYSLLLVDEILRIFDAADGEISLDDIADTLSNYMDQNLNMICEDGSPEEVAADLIHFFSCYLVQDLDGFNLHLSRLPKITVWLQADELPMTPEACTNFNSVNSLSSSEELIDATTSIDEKVGSSLGKEDGWTTVLSKSRRSNS